MLLRDLKDKDDMIEKLNEQIREITELAGADPEELKLRAPAGGGGGGDGACSCACQGGGGGSQGGRGQSAGAGVGAGRAGEGAAGAGDRVEARVTPSVGQELRRAKEGSSSAAASEGLRAELARVQDDLSKAQGKIAVRHLLLRARCCRPPCHCVPAESRRRAGQAEARAGRGH